MNFVFENQLSNFTSCDDINNSGIRRFSLSPMVETLINFSAGYERCSIYNRPKKYIIPTGVNHHPNDWTGASHLNNRQGCFSYLSKLYLHDLRNGNAMLLFDQSLEGYQTTWLWKYFHDECEKYQIDPNAVIYVTGNLIAASQYEYWAVSNNIKDRISVISYSHFEKDIFTIATSDQKLISLTDSINYKKENLEKIKTYNCLQKRLRNHRVWFYTELFKSNLLNDGLVSMNVCDSRFVSMEGRILDQNLLSDSNALLPLTLYNKPNNTEPDNFYIRRILKEVYLDSWVSVISEASFSDDENTVFISEKTFKSIASFHPFIIFGNKGSLKKLKEMGYKTFDGFIDESYDELSTFERMDAIINSIKKINYINDKLSWFMSMQEILNHNYEVLKRNSEKLNPAVKLLNRSYKSYFNRKSNV